MTYSHPLRQHIQKKYRQGFTLIELLIATLFGGIVAASAGGMLINSMRSGAALETTQRLRMDWNRTSHFIESEVAMSERVFTDESKLNLAQCDSSITNEEFSFGLEIRRHLPPAIYYIRSNETQNLEWVGESSLWRCGPNIDEDGNYTNIIDGNSSTLLTAQRLIDGMNNTCTLTVTSSENGVSKSLNYELCLRGSTNFSYSQSVNTHTRIIPVYSYPNFNSLCSDEILTIEGFYKLDGGTTSADLLELPSFGLTDYDDILICGYGGGDTIKGSSANDVLEAGGNNNGSDVGAYLYGYEGSDRLLGGPSDDALYGGNGDDVLISGDGNDMLDGGNGENHYLVNEGSNTVQGGTGLDIIFIDDIKNNVIGPNQCKRNDCELQYNNGSISGNISATQVEVIILRDGRFDISN